jgi:hypothetical protein
VKPLSHAAFLLRRPLFDGSQQVDVVTSRLHSLTFLQHFLKRLGSEFSAWGGAKAAVSR